MRNKMFTVLVVALFISAFLPHTTAHATAPTDTKAPVLTARLSGETLHIEAKDEVSNVEAVYIDGHKVSYPKKGVLDAPFRTYAGTGQYVSVYAVDYAGNKSDTVQVENPYYKASPVVTNTTALPSGKITESVVPSQPHPFTPEGTGTTVDNTTESDGKEFFTITTPDKNVFYLIIDRQRQSENVYFLNAVTEDDLRSLTKKGSTNSDVSAVPAPQITSKPETIPEPGPKSQPEKGSNSTLIFVLLAVVAAGSTGYYFKIYKPKHQSANSDEEEFDEDETDYEEEAAHLSDKKEDTHDFLPSEDEFGEFDGDDPYEEERE